MRRHHACSVSGSSSASWAWVSWSSNCSWGGSALTLQGRSDRARTRARLLRALLEPPRAAREAFPVIVLPDYLATVAVEDDERRGATPVAVARLAERVRRQARGIDRRGGHWRGSTAPQAGRAGLLRPDP